MSRLLENLPRALLRALIAWLLALGLGMPLLCGIGLPFLLSRYILLCAAVCLGCSLLNLRRWVLPAVLLAALALQGALLASGRGLLQDAVTLARALSLLARGVSLDLLMHGDLLCVQLALLLSLFCYALSSPDLDVALPLTVVSGTLGAQWMMGLRHESLYMLPALPALLLIYALTHSNAEAAPNAAPARTSPALIPLAALLLAIAWLAAPADGVKSAPLANAAEQLREMINDRFFFQQERARYTLAADGWMPQGERRLGGRPDPDERLVMQVETDETLYLRGAILDAYTGAAWYDSVSARRYYWNSPTQRALRDALFQTDYPLDTVLAERQATVHFASAGASTLFVPQRLRSLSVGPHMTPYFNRSSEIFITRNLESGDSYSFSFLPMKATDSGMAALAQRAAEAEDPAYAEAEQLYTVLPGHIQQEIYDIAAAVTANCATDWQKATALRDYLRSQYGYTLNVQDPPRDVDFVAWFLLAEKEGYCTYFASAMTVLSRMAGLPARYVEGYVVRPQPGGVSAVRGTNAHAWTEIYLKGLGWVTFDATPGQGDQDNSGGGAPPPMGQTPTPVPPQEEPTPSPSPAPSQEPPQDAPTPTPTPPQQPPSDPGGTPPEPPGNPPESKLPWLWLLLALLLLLLAARIRVTEPLYRAAHAPDSDSALRVLWGGILDCGESLRLPHLTGETPLAYARRAEDALSIPLRETARAVSALQYGRHSAAPAALRGAREAYAALHERLNLWQKLMLALRRALRFRRRK